MGDIILTRPNQDIFKVIDYGIYVDGKKVNTIRDGSHKVIKLAKGDHQVYVKVFGAKSNSVNINIKDRESVRLTCKSELTGIKYLFSYLYIFSKGLLKLEYTKV